MAKERLKSPRSRLFVALDLPDAVRAQLAAWQAAECADPALRPLDPAQLHLTLCLLGWQRERDVEPIAEVVTGVEPRAVELRFLAAPVPRPKRGRPGLFALEADSPGAVKLQGELSAQLEARRFHKPEKRPFWPHLTVARVRPERAIGAGGRRRRGKPRRLATPPGPLPRGLERPFDAVRISLYRSTLRPEGAEYVSLVTMELPPTAAER